MHTRRAPASRAVPCQNAPVQVKEVKRCTRYGSNTGCETYTWLVISTIIYIHINHLCCRVSPLLLSVLWWSSELLLFSAPVVQGARSLSLSLFLLGQVPLGWARLKAFSSSTSHAILGLALLQGQHGCSRLLLSKMSRKHLHCILARIVDPLWHCSQDGFFWDRPLAYWGKACAHTNPVD